MGVHGISVRYLPLTIKRVQARCNEPFILGAVGFSHIGSRYSNLVGFEKKKKNLPSASKL